MGKVHITIRDIARQCHASTATVSRALNHQPGVSEKLRASILHVAAEYGYEPNPSARSLRSQRTDVIYLIIREGASKDIPFDVPLLQKLRLMVRMDLKVHSLPYGCDLVEDLQKLEAIGTPRLMIITGPCFIADSSAFILY